MHEVLVDFISIAPSIWTPIQIAALLVLLLGYVFYHIFRQRKQRAEQELELNAPAPEFGADYLGKPNSKSGG